MRQILVFSLQIMVFFYQQALSTLQDETTLTVGPQG